MWLETDHIQVHAAIELDSHDSNYRASCIYLDLKDSGWLLSTPSSGTAMTQSDEPLTISAIHNHPIYQDTLE
jgi:hypothetical protein